MAPNSLASRWPLARCVWFGLGIGCVYAVLAMVAGTGLGEGFADRYGLNVGQVVLLDLVGGLFGGGLVGILLPRVGGPVGWVLLAQASILPAYALFALSAPEGDGIELIDAIGASLLVGGFVGVTLWHRYGKDVK